MIFMELPRKQITPSPYIQQVLEDHGATCSECGNELGIGDYIDNYYPWFSEYNICDKCYKEVQD